VPLLTWRAISAGPDPSALFRALGPEVVKQMVLKGEGEAQFSLGCVILKGVDGGPAGRSPKADVGLARGTADSFPDAHQSKMRRCGHLMTECIICGCQP